MWVDEQGRARRLTVEGQGDMTMTVDYYDFGLPVTIEIPEKTISDEQISKEFRGARR